MIRAFVSIFLALLCTFSSEAQESILSHFGLDVSNGKVLLSWTIKSGSTCNGIDILRSTDSINFIEIGYIPGVCGDISSPKSYTFTDQNPVDNAINYYKIDLGGQEKSQVLGIEVIAVAENDYLLRPNPVADYAELRFSNSNQHSIVFTLYDLNGAVIHQEESISELIKIDATIIRNGMYHFTLVNKLSGKLITGRILVAH